MNFETSFAPLDSAKKHSSLSMVKEIGKQLLVMGNSLNLLLHIAVNRSIGTSRQEHYQFSIVSNLDSGELAYSLMEFQYVENNGSTAVITLDTSLAQLEKTFGAPEFRPGIQEDGKGSWNPYAGFPRYAWNGMEVAVIPHMIKVFSEDDISYIEKEDDPIIRIIDITGNEFKTSLGAGSGTDKLDVIDLYGKPYSEQDNFITYISGSIMGTAYLTFTFDSNERVEGVSLYWGD